MRALIRASRIHFYNLRVGHFARKLERVCEEESLTTPPHELATKIDVILAGSAKASVRLMEMTDDPRAAFEEKVRSLSAIIDEQSAVPLSYAADISRRLLKAIVEEMDRRRPFAFSSSQQTKPTA